MNTKINFAGIEMKNPVTVASGTFGYGREFSNFFEPSISKVFKILQSSTYSSILLPQALTIIAVSKFLKKGKSFVAKYSTMEGNLVTFLI